MRARTTHPKGLLSLVLFLTAAFLTPLHALAYVGPGAGISMLGALWGLVIGVVMAVGVILFWPIRMMIRKNKAKKAAAAAEGSEVVEAEAEPQQKESSQNS